MDECSADGIKVQALAARAGMPLRALTNPISSVTYKSKTIFGKTINISKGNAVANHCNHTDPSLALHRVPGVRGRLRVSLDERHGPIAIVHLRAKR